MRVFLALTPVSKSYKDSKFLVTVRYVSLLEKKLLFQRSEFDINLLSDEDDYVRMINLKI